MEKLINRAKELILQPKIAWQSITGEKTEIIELLKSYIIPLALIPALASFIGYGFIGISIPFGGRMYSVEWGFSQALTSFISPVLGIFLSAGVISWLAPKYNTTVSFQDAAKLVAYSCTPAFVGGVFNIIPALAILTLVAGVYSLYVLYLGFKPITNVSDDKSTSFFVVSLLVFILAYIVLAFILGALWTTIGLTSFKY